jgi:heptosyltransferase-1
MRIGAMGDVLHAMPAVAALRQRHPEWFIGWAIDPCWAELLQTTATAERGPAMPLLDRCYMVPTREWNQRPFSPETMASIRAVRRELRGERFGRFDLCVDMQGSIRSSMIGWMAGADRFAGCAEPRERPARWMYGQKINVNAAHVIEQGCEILGGAVGEPLTPAKVELPIDNAAEAWRDELLSRIVPADKKFVVIAPSAGWGAKQWPAERYGAVAAELARAGYVPLVNAVFSGDILANAVVDASGGAAVVVPCSVGRLIALIRRASLVIAGDTGPLHLAAALERPVVALFGPTDPARNGPYGTASRVLRHASSKKDHTRHAETEEGLMQITSEEVVAAAFDLLQSAR